MIEPVKRKAAKKNQRCVLTKNWPVYLAKSVIVDVMTEVGFFLS